MHFKRLRRSKQCLRITTNCDTSINATIGDFYLYLSNLDFGVGAYWRGASIGGFTVFCIYFNIPHNLVSPFPFNCPARIFIGVPIDPH